MVSKIIDEEFLKKFSGLIQIYEDRFLADDSVRDLDLLLLSIYLIEKKNKKSGAENEEVKELFISLGRKDNNFNVAKHRAKEQNFAEDKDTQLYLLMKGLKRIRNLLGQIEKSPVHIIKSGQNFTAIKLFEEFLSTEIEDNEILLCDSHISSSTLFPLSVLKGKIKSIKILTANVYDSDKFEDYKEKLKKEMGASVEVKINKKIHDRYLICGNKCWYIGSSIKDLGNKDTIIREISDVVTSLKDLFLERWNESS